jgi:hypothetical protein
MSLKPQTVTALILYKPVKLLPNYKISPVTQPIPMETDKLLLAPEPSDPNKSNNSSLMK